MAHGETELPAGVDARIQELSEQGNLLADQGKPREAIEKFIAALGLVPEPITDWEASTWLLASIGDMNFQLKAYAHAGRRHALPRRYRQSFSPPAPRPMPARAG